MIVMSRTLITSHLKRKLDNSDAKENTVKAKRHKENVVIENTRQTRADTQKRAQVVFNLFLYMVFNLITYLHSDGM